MILLKFGQSKKYEIKWPVWDFSFENNYYTYLTKLFDLNMLQVRNATAVFIINLSVSDLSFCCFNLPLAASTFWHRSWKHGQLLCRLFPLVRYGLLAVSLFTILAITINRYIMIGHPSLYPKYVKICIWFFFFCFLISEISIQKKK